MGTPRSRRVGLAGANVSSALCLGMLDPAVVAVSRPVRYVLLYTQHITVSRTELVLTITHDYMSNNEYTGTHLLMNMSTSQFIYS